PGFGSICEAGLLLLIRAASFIHIVRRMSAGISAGDAGMKLPVLVGIAVRRTLVFAPRRAFTEGSGLDNGAVRTVGELFGRQVVSLRFDRGQIGKFFLRSLLQEAVLILSHWKHLQCLG